MFQTITNFLKKNKTTYINCKNIKLDNNDKDLANKFNNYSIDLIKNIIENDDININRCNLFDYDCRNHLNKFKPIYLTKDFNYG